MGIGTEQKRGSNLSIMFIISHYKDNYDWVKRYTDSFIVYHKDNVNVGYNISTMMSFIVENYEHLPDVCVFVKDNVLERHITREEFDKVIGNKTFTPLLTQKHEEKEGICYYKDGMYYEVNNSWFFSSYPSKYFHSYNEFADIMGLPKPDFIPFAPGASYIVPKENILKHPKEFYQKLLEFCSWSQINAESHCIERALYIIWK